MALFHNTLIDWFQQNKRNLPWRNSHNPYLIWISEIIFQQTRIEQGLPWYLRFTERFPDVKTLADASEEDVLLIWQGLGYYSRARNLHIAARQVMMEFNGEFPKTFDQIRKLKGVGEYTASAIASISFGLPHAVIDGNVYRVLARLYGNSTPIDSIKGKREFSQLATDLLDKDHPGLYNEAIMEFGALHCRPSNPLCSECPFMKECYAYKNEKTDDLPVKEKKSSQRNRYFNYLFIEYKDQFYLQKREGKDIWKNLYELPLIETEIDTDDKRLVSSALFNKIFDGNHPVIVSVKPTITHQLSHQKLFIRFLNVCIDQPIPDKNYLLISHGQMRDFPFPKPIFNYLEKKFGKTI